MPLYHPQPPRARSDEAREIALKRNRWQRCCRWVAERVMPFLVLLLIWMFAGPAFAAQDTLVGKHIVGYQGWYGCPSDPVDPRWSHWIHRSKDASEPALSVDLWPDLGEFDKDELCTVKFGGREASVFSSENAKTVRRHFRWMREYNIDGAALQRFVSEITRPKSLSRFNAVLHYAQSAAEAEGRGYFVVYDVSGVDGATAVAAIKKDWPSLVASGSTGSKAYMHHRGKPLVGIWGMGVSGREVTPEQALDLLAFLRGQGVSLFGGVATYWRTGQHDAGAEPAWQNVYKAFDVLSPWTVGRYRDGAGAQNYAYFVLSEDIRLAAGRGQDVMPVAFPGFSWANLQDGRSPLDQIPRRCGAFYGEQVTAFLRAGGRMLFTAMFDELDEGTAIMKVQRRPDGVPFDRVLAPDAGQCEPGSDLYLKAAARATRDVYRAARQ